MSPVGDGIGDSIVLCLGWRRSWWGLTRTGVEKGESVAVEFRKFDKGGGTGGRCWLHFRSPFINYFQYLSFESKGVPHDFQ